MYQKLNMKRLKVNNISYRSNDKTLFSNVSFVLNAGESVHIKGENGSGKTTLLKILCGLTLPDQGEIYWQDSCIKSNPYDYQKNLYYLAHQLALKPQLTVWENLYYFPKPLHVDAQSMHQQLEQFGLITFLHKPVGFLSQGQKQMLALLRIFLQDATLWILDEPFTALDEANKTFTLQIFSAHLENQGMIIFTSHDVQSHLSSQTLHLDHFKV